MKFSDEIPIIEEEENAQQQMEISKWIHTFLYNIGNDAGHAQCL
jgi:hypothetical protein